jgi:hypothetical protein
MHPCRHHSQLKMASKPLKVQSILLVGFKLITLLVSSNSSCPYRASELNPSLRRVYGAWSLVFCAVFCRSLVFLAMLYKTLHRKLTIKHHKPNEDWDWAQMLCKGKKSLKIPRGLSEFVNRRRSFWLPCSPKATSWTSSSDSNWRPTIFSCEFIILYVVCFIDINRFQKSNFLCFSG